MASEYKKVSILGIIFFPQYVALTHSINKRAINNEPITGGKLFFWTLGWQLAFILGIAGWIYCGVKYSEINQVRQQIASKG